ncbi:hypothetical protein [Marinilactibacillus piezotolerans]|uniref:hypothetical protein n=1 Tax=Marinilactibacillus piezotolerans TaxID=258723 RepID=UPI0009AF2DF9|nr:hypothetical protein [Marinilactibacillus piezotolerans]
MRAGILLLLVVLVSGVLAKKYADKPKKDKGVQVVYYGLSHRRKMIRILISIPFVLGIFALMYFFTEVEWILPATFSVVAAAYLGYIAYQEYNLWKEEQKKGKKEAK